MSLPLLEQIETALFGVGGNYYILAFAILFFFIIAFMFAGIDFRLSSLLFLPLFLAFGNLGWLPGWIVGSGMIFIVGFNLFMVWNWIRER